MKRKLYIDQIFPFEDSPSWDESSTRFSCFRLSYTCRSPWALVQTGEGGSSSLVQKYLINICYASVLTGETSGFVCSSLVIVSCPALQATQRPLCTPSVGCMVWASPAHGLLPTSSFLPWRKRSSDPYQDILFLMLTTHCCLFLFGILSP